MYKLDYKEEIKIIENLVWLCFNACFDFESAYAFSSTHIPKLFIEIYRDVNPDKSTKLKIMNTFSLCLKHCRNEISSNLLILPILELFCAQIEVEVSSDKPDLLFSLLSGTYYLLKYGEEVKFKNNIVAQEIESYGIAKIIEDLLLHPIKKISDIAKKINYTFFVQEENEYNGSI